MTTTHYRETDYGFEYGEAIVTRMLHNKDGSVFIGISSRAHPHKYLQVNVSAKGKSVTVFGHGYDGKKSKTRKAKR